MAAKPERIQKKVSFDQDLEDVKDYTVDDDYHLTGNDVMGVRRATSDRSHNAGRSRKEVHLRVRSVTFADGNDEEASVRRRLCRTPTPFWPRSDSQVGDAGSMDAEFSQSIDEESYDDVGGNRAEEFLSPPTTDGCFTVPSPRSSPSAKRAFLAKKHSKVCSSVENAV